MRGKFITFEGGEGTGKSTQVTEIAKYLQSKDIPVLVTREPGGTASAEKIREILVKGSVDQWDSKAELFLMLAARRTHIVEKILPNLNQGIWVLCDRFQDSTFAYQGYARGLSIDMIQNLSNYIIEDCFPDRTYIFMVNPADGLNRTIKRTHTEDRFEKMDLSFHERVLKGYQSIATANPQRCLLVNAYQSISEIAEIIIQDLNENFYFS